MTIRGETSYLLASRAMVEGDPSYCFRTRGLGGSRYGDNHRTTTRSLITSNLYANTEPMLPRLFQSKVRSYEPS